MVLDEEVPVCQKSGEHDVEHFLREMNAGPHVRAQSLSERSDVGDVKARLWCRRAGVQL
jgi:hypothetical protein